MPPRFHPFGKYPELCPGAAQPVPLTGNTEPPGSFTGKAREGLLDSTAGSCFSNWDVLGNEIWGDIVFLAPRDTWRAASHQHPRQCGPGDGRTASSTRRGRARGPELRDLGWSWLSRPQAPHRASATAPPTPAGKAPRKWGCRVAAESGRFHSSLADPSGPCFQVVWH